MLTTEEAREALHQAEERDIRLALTQTGGNVTRAARQLRISRPTLYRHMEQYGIRRIVVIDPA